MLAAVRSATLVGVDGQPVTVEVHVSSGLPAYQVVGLPDAAVRESRERVRAAVLSSSWRGPSNRITVNLAPGGVRKIGRGPRARGRARRARRQRRAARRRARRRRRAGRARARRLRAAGAGHARARRRARARGRASRWSCRSRTPTEAALVGDVRVRAARHPRRAPRVPEGRGAVARLGSTGAAATIDEPRRRRRRTARPRRRARACPSRARRSRSPPPVGTTCCSAGRPARGRRCSPADSARSSHRSSHAEALEVTRIHSAAGDRGRRRLVRRRPFRAPHHTASTAALVGGGSGRPAPGEVTLAHRGMLFLDELGEFAPTALDALRQPLEERVVRISRQGVSLTFPAAFQLVACSNPCPCGVGRHECRCSDAQRERYRRRLSAPLLDRFDLRLRVDAPESDDGAGESSADVAARVAVAYERQRARYADWPWSQNAHVPAGAVPRLLPLGPERRRGVARAHRRSRGSPGAAPPASGGWPARSPTSTTASASPPRTSSRPPACVGTCRERGPTTPALDPIEVAAATLASLPDMTHRRAARAGRTVAADPVGALAGLRARAGRGGAVRAARPRPSSPARQSLARRVAGGGAQRPHRARRWCARRTRVVRRGSTRATRSTRTSPTGPRCCSPRATAPTRSTGRGSPSSAPAPRRPTGSTTRASSAPRWRARA